MKSNNKERLLALMSTHQLSVTKVSELLGRSKGTVRNWRAGTPCAPDHIIELLELKVWGVK